MSVGICDVTLAINTLALAFALISVGLAWFNKTRPGLLLMAVTLVMQSIAIYRPGCALRGINRRCCRTDDSGRTPWRCLSQRRGVGLWPTDIGDRK